MLQGEGTSWQRRVEVERCFWQCAAKAEGCCWEGAAGLEGGSARWPTPPFVASADDLPLPAFGQVSLTLAVLRLRAAAGKNRHHWHARAAPLGARRGDLHRHDAHLRTPPAELPMKEAPLARRSDEPPLVVLQARGLAHPTACCLLPVACFRPSPIACLYASLGANGDDSLRDLRLARHRGPGLHLPQCAAGARRRRDRDAAARRVPRGGGLVRHPPAFGEVRPRGRQRLHPSRGRRRPLGPRSADAVPRLRDPRARCRARRDVHGVPQRPGVQRRQALHTRRRPGAARPARRHRGGDRRARRGVR